MFCFRECWIFPWHSLSYVTTDSVFVWVYYQEVTSFTVTLWRQRGLNILESVLPIQDLEQQSQSRGQILVLGIQRVSQSFNFCNNSCYGVSWFYQELWTKKKKEELRIEQSINVSKYCLISLKFIVLGQKEARVCVQNLQLDIVQEISAFPPLTPGFLGWREDKREVVLFIPYILSILMFFPFSCVLLLSSEHCIGPFKHFRV